MTNTERAIREIGKITEVNDQYHWAIQQELVRIKCPVKVYTKDEIKALEAQRKGMPCNTHKNS